jgi:uncharacterized membrane protein
MVARKWTRRHSKGIFLPIYFGAVATVSVLWILRAGIEPGFNYHLLGVTALCLMFDGQFAVLRYRSRNG